MILLGIKFSDNKYIFEEDIIDCDIDLDENLDEI